mgnify:CR=1 FL=1
MWKLVVDNDAKYTARPGVRIVTNFVMRSRARLRRGEGTPPYGGRARRCGAWGEYGLPHR